MNTKQESKFFNKRNIVGLFIIFIMVSSILAIWQSSTEDTTLKSYNGYKFSVRGSNLITEVNGKEVSFRYHPTDLEYLELDDEAKTGLKSASKYYLTFDPESEWVNYLDILRLDITSNNFLENFNRHFTDAVAKQSSVYVLPIITCQNSTFVAPVLYFKIGNETKIKRDSSCYIIEASTAEDFFKAKDMIIYTILGIM